ncbi:MAG: hypothetical protein VX667_02000 [Nitrospinota bacterium]|nr:hypothetical protein [Nitrospinota bacterium]
MNHIRSLSLGYLFSILFFAVGSADANILMENFPDNMGQLFMNGKLQTFFRH